MRCRHCGQRVEFNTSTREWVHVTRGILHLPHVDNTACIIAGADVGTTADPDDERDAP